MRWVRAEAGGEEREFSPLLDRRPRSCCFLASSLPLPHRAMTEVRATGDGRRVRKAMVGVRGGCGVPGEGETATGGKKSV